MTPGTPNGRTALITGITGQDESYLAELLLGKGYAVHGRIRPAATSTRSAPGATRESTGEMHTVRELCETAFGLVGLDWQQYVRADASKATEKLGWRPETQFLELVRLMLEHDLRDAGLETRFMASRSERKD